ncbi:hypothetical protein [Piscirickettsia litoralis]|uniref:Histidine phosphatase family protein n=1 Tax=Piscirickettsia litoralis TaxID=1891921 RepID=A0ABX2ZZ14_9GAMM|nr:hypothetical protein [Piscirickettsia litoralis]ODN41866.1 hypothetical protein BGC07_01395 [Piscirickettsia litoralis]
MDTSKIIKLSLMLLMVCYISILNATACNQATIIIRHGQDTNLSDKQYYLSHSGFIHAILNRQALSAFLSKIVYVQ